MFNPFKALAYKNEVLATLYSILYVYPGGTKRLVKDQPGILQAIKTNQKDNTPAVVAGVFIAAAVLTNSLKTLSENDREAVLSQLADLDIPAFKQMVNKTMKGTYSFPAGMHYGTIAVGLALTMVWHYTDAGDISQMEMQFFQTEIEGALQGLDEQARFAGRLRGFFDDMFASRGG